MYIFRVDIRFLGHSASMRDPIGRNKGGIKNIFQHRMIMIDFLA